MKEILVALATYNRDASHALCELLSRQDDTLLREEQGSFYKSILGTLEHIAQGEIGWLRRFKGFYSYPSLSSAPLLACSPDEATVMIKAGFPGLRETLATLDGLLLSFAKELDEATLHGRMKFKNFKGEDLERDYWNLVLHILNHGTHHRGEISALLDRKGVANDYSGFNLYTR
ncbi:MAG: DinB family protein [Spirochaetota bacterium]